ncbi:MAG: tRNA (adenosine(37)-N6)-threonylcarbamoyltransferase complex dimerization subunit type 1 TsaB [Clostridia bacterium]|nr:tRNA (adenosine(37)-N6)-threonylcarbamoyltransferase complex dimerization subunit type 1 TsaB [Clostridia bacterium]
MNEYDINKGVILAFDSSALTCSAGVIKDGKAAASVFSNNGLTHSKTLLPSIEKVLADSQTDADGVSAVAVTVGPGSFTGVKIGVSTAKGIAFTKNLPCLAVSSTAASACGAAGFDGMICPVFDARRGMLYNALFLSEKGGVKRLCADRQISAEELAKELKKTDKKILITGDGAEIFAKECEKKGLSFSLAAQSVMFIRPEGIYEAIKNGLYEEKTQENLSAVYLRPPQAERERLEKLEAEKKHNKQGE